MNKLRAVCLSLVAISIVIAFPVTSQASDAPSATATPSPSEEPSFYTKVTDDAGKAGNLAIGVVKVAGVIGAISLVAWAVRRRRKRQLLVPDFVNASAIDEIDKMLPGLSQLLRQALIEEIETLHHTTRMEALREKRLQDNIGNVEAARQAPLPRAALDDTLAQIAAAFKDFPAGIGPFAQIIGLAWFQPGGTSVAGIFQRNGDAPGRLSISFNVSDLREEIEPVAFTIPEPPPINIPDAAPRRGSTGRGQEVRGLVALGTAYERLRAREEARTQYAAALEKEPAEAASRGLLAVLPAVRSPHQRYRQLIRPAAYRLAVEIYSREALR